MKKNNKTRRIEALKSITLIGIVIAVIAITLLYAFMSNAILINEEVGPKLSDPHKQSMKVETVVDGLSFPTSMEFIDNENMLVLEKDTGTVRLGWNIRERASVKNGGRK